MKAFEFRLQTKLDVSCREEQMVKENLQEKILQYDQIQAQVDTIEARLHALEDRIKKIMIQSLCVEMLITCKDYTAVLKKEQEIKNIELLKAEQAVNRARAALIQKSKETTTLKKLREKEWRLYMTEVLKEEQIIIDEIAVSSHFRKNHY